MKKYTLEDLRTFERNENGFIICPTGDYTDIKEFPCRCSFGKCCSFSKRCSFGECCSFGERCECEQNYEFEKLFQIGYIGSRDDTTQFWLLTDKSILVRCGCFCGNIDEFIEAVKGTHGDTLYAKEYIAAAELAELHFGVKERNHAEK